MSVSCITCIENGRHCDKRGPVCASCCRAEERSCKWPTPPPPRALTVEISPQWLESSNEAENVFSNEKSRRMLEIDFELQDLLAAVDTAVSDDGMQMNAMLAILATNLREQSSDWVNFGLEKYGLAYNAVYSHINQPIDATIWRTIGVTISLNNIFERHDQYSNNRYVHLSGLHQWIGETMSQGLDATSMPCSAIKSLMYYTAIGSTFSFSRVARERHFSYVSDLQNIVLSKSSHGCLKPRSIFGVPMEIFDHVFKISYLRQMRAEDPSAPGVRSQLRELKGKIDTFEFDPFAETHNSHHQREQAQRLTKLICAACAVLICKVMQPNMRRAGVESIIARVWPIVTAIDTTRYCPATAWPLLVLFFAGTRIQRDNIRRLLDRQRQAFNLQRHGAILDYLERLEHSQTIEGGDAAIFDVLLQGDVGDIELL